MLQNWMTRLIDWASNKPMLTAACGARSLSATRWADIQNAEPGLTSRAAEIEPPAGVRSRLRRPRLQGRRMLRLVDPELPTAGQR